MDSYSYQVQVDTNDESLKKDINLDVDDPKVLTRKVAFRLQECKASHDKKCTEARANMALFDGDVEKVMRTGQANQYNSRSLKNVLFLTIRNLVGLSTDTTPVPDVQPAKETPQSQKKARIVASSLDYDMVRVGFQDMYALNLFDTWIKGDSYFHPFWNYKLNDNDLDSVQIEELSIADGSESIQDAEYVVYHPWKSRTWWKKNYPDQYEKIKFESKKTDGTMDTSGVGRGTVARFIGYWENDIRVEQVMGKDGEWILLKASKNPYWEYRSTDEQIMLWAQERFPEVAALAEYIGVNDEEGIKMMVQDPEVNPGATIGDMEEFSPIINFLAEPTKPFVQLPSIKLMKDLYSKPIINQVREAFLALNMAKRQLDDNIRGVGAKLVIDSDTFTEEQAAAITDEPLQMIRISFQNQAKPVYYLEPAKFDMDKLLASMADDKQYIDDVFGHHEISRGSGQANTLGQDQMNFESDKTPIRFQVRASENAIVEIWKYWIQLKKMFYTDVHYIKKMGATDGTEVLELMSKDIEEGIDPILRPMSTAPVSKMFKAQQSMALAEAGLLDPHTLYTDLGRNDPDGLTNRLLNWNLFKIVSSEDPAEVAADMQDHKNSNGDSTDNPVERAAEENKAMQNGEDVPPTPPELVTPEHVKLHYAFMKDPKNKMEQDAMDNIRNHALADKATLLMVMKTTMKEKVSGEVKAEGQAARGAQQPAQNGAAPVATPPAA